MIMAVTRRVIFKKNYNDDPEGRVATHLIQFIINQFGTLTMDNVSAHLFQGTSKVFRSDI